MRIPSGKTDQKIYFVALDANDRVTRKTGLSSFTVYRSRKGGTATVYTTPTVAELDATNMPGVYSLLIDEDTTVDSASDSEEYAVHITVTGMAPVTRTIELYRRDTTSGKTLTVDGNSRADASVGAVAAGVISAASFAANALDAVWSTATRLLTAGTNIVLAKGTGLTGLNDLSAAQVNAEVDTALADAGVTVAVTGRIDAAISTRLAAASYTAPDNSSITAIKAKTDNLPASPAAASDIPTANDNADALLDRADGVETSRTLRQSVRLMLAALCGKASGLATTTAVYRDTNDTKARITATVDENGNRSAVTLDAT